METSSPDRGTQVPPVLRSVRRQAGAAGSETKRRTTSSQVHSKVVVLTVTEGQNELEAITDMYHQCCHTWRCQGQWHLQPPPPPMGNISVWRITWVIVMWSAPECNLDYSVSLFVLLAAITWSQHHMTGAFMELRSKLNCKRRCIRLSRRILTHEVHTGRLAEICTANASGVFWRTSIRLDATLGRGSSGAPRLLRATGTVTNTACPLLGPRSQVLVTPWWNLSIPSLIGSESEVRVLRPPCPPNTHGQRQKQYLKYNWGVTL